MAEMLNFPFMVFTYVLVKSCTSHWDFYEVVISRLCRQLLPFAVGETAQASGLSIVYRIVNGVHDPKLFRPGFVDKLSDVWFLS